jgi:hypothetical protein
MSRKAKPKTFTQRHAESISKLKLVLIVVCLVAIPLSLWLNQKDIGSVNNRVTKIESPCKRFGPDSKVCQKAFEIAVKSITHRIACYIDHESGRPFKPSCIGVHLRIETPVPKLDTGTAAVESDEGPNAAADGGDATSSPSTGHSQPTPGDGGGGEDGSGGTHGAPVPGKGGGGAPAPEGSGDTAPSAPPASSASQPPATSTTERTAEATVVEKAPAPEVAKAPVREAVGGVVEGVTGTVEETGGTVNEVVGGVTETTCSLAKLLCHE